MTTKPRNPPAFPQRASDRRVAEYAPGWDDGLSIRDYFAARAPAMPSWFSANRTKVKEVVPWTEKGPGWVREQMVTHHEPAIDHLARWRYHYADAMLRAREANP